MRLAQPATTGTQQQPVQERARQAQQAQPQLRPPAPPQPQPGPEQRPPPAQHAPQQPRPTQAVAPTQPAGVLAARAPPPPLASRIKPEPPSSPSIPCPSLAPTPSSAPPAPPVDIKPLVGRLGPLPHATAAGDGGARASPSADELRTFKERADELRAAEARAAELRRLEAAEAAEAKEREERAERERREKERREADARREKEERDEEERQEKERREAAEREKEKRREKERIEMERLERELLEMERRRTDEMVEAARRVAEERAAAEAQQRALEEKREAERVAAEERAAVEAAAAEDQRSRALRMAEERAFAELRAAEAELREAEARAAARRASKERARASAEGAQGGSSAAAGAQGDRTRETTAEGLARETELRRLVAERGRRARSAARARDPASQVEVVDAVALSDSEDGDRVMDEDDEVEPRTTTRPRTTSAPTWDAEVPPLQEQAPYEWAQPGPIPSLAAIVARREEIFTKQRTFNDPELQRKSQDLIAAKLATYARSGSYSTFAYKVSAYCSFCRAVDIPPWPATPPVLALFAHQVSYYATSSRGVLIEAFNMIHKVCRDLWGPLPAFKELLEWPGAQAAVLEWKKQSPTAPTSGSPARQAQEPAQAEGDNGKDGSAAAPAEIPRGKRGRTIPQYFCPGLPAVGATFPSSLAAHEQIAAAMIPVYGNGLDIGRPSKIMCNRHGTGCPMCIHLCGGGGRWRVLESSNFFHNHERDSRIVKDPAWRPVIRNSTVREAVEKRDVAAGIRTTTVNPKKRDDNPGPDPPAPKKQARAPPSTSLPERPVFPPSSPAKSATAAALTAPQHAGFAPTSTSTSTAPSVEPAVPPSAPPVPPPPPPAPSTASPAPPAPARRSGVTPSFHLPAPDPAAFLADLTSFLSALDPSLAPLAQPLHSAGISTLRDLRAFVQFEPATRMALYEDLHTSGGDAAMLDVDVVERLENALAAAQASAWR
ncbi:hypothetical protein JCM3775_002319 [Rhodotorula graminis]